MSDLNDLEQRIKEKLAATDQRRQLEQNHLQQRMLEFDERHKQYIALADKLFKDMIRPRMHKLAEHFANAVFPQCDPPRRQSCVLVFQNTTRFPASATLELGVSRDGQCQTVMVLYSLDILPVFFQFEGRDQLTFPLDRVDQARVAEWVDQKILEFVETYLRLEGIDQYQKDNLVIDPVCGMRINRAYAAAQMMYQGQTYYFCLEDCKKKFAENPSAYLDTPGPVAR
jgi:YHS domain-containing protein